MAETGEARTRVRQNPNRNRTHVRDEVEEGVAAQRADRQRHQEAEEELEEDPVHERDEDDPDQGQQADDGDGGDAADPGWNARRQAEGLSS